MATTNSTVDAAPANPHTGNGLLVLLPVLDQPQLDVVLRQLAASLPGEDVTIAARGEVQADSYPSLRLVVAPSTQSSWTLTANDYASAFQLGQKQGARAVLILGPECASLSTNGLRDLANAVLLSPTDLAVPCYDLPPRAGLVNSSILYPLNRALFANRVRFPLPVDLGLSLRMAERLAGLAQRFIAQNQNENPIWSVSEATVGGMTVEEVEAGPRTLPQPAEPDLNNVLPFVTGSLFSDIDAKAAFWQRARVIPPSRRQIPTAQPPATDANSEIAPLIQGFRLAYSNLQEIWGLVLPPNSMLSLKRLSQVDGAAFRMPDSLWVRIVFDFLVAYRLRTLNRSHLLGALIPLYLAWVASHINVIASGADPERHIEALAAAFETDKPYLVARWRWPDRFNP